MAKKNKIQLGDLVKDEITGFEGIVTGKHKWIHGCKRYSVQPRNLDKDNKPIAAQSFDEPQLILLTKRAELKQSVRTTGMTGGPRDEPSQREAPER
jgi:hypothetical protein